MNLNQLKSLRARFFSCCAAAMVVAFLGAPQVKGDLQITEIMYNPLQEPGSNTWEWFEVRNTDMVNSVDLNGAIFRKLGTNTYTSGGTPSISSAPGFAMNTIIPAGGVAVLYNGRPTVTAAHYQDQVFRDAWNLDASVPLIAVNDFSLTALSNSGTNRNFGLWLNETDYFNDVTLDGVVSYAYAAVSIDYSTIPSGSSSAYNGFSAYWDESGTYQDTANHWFKSENAMNGAYTSVPSDTMGSLNNTADRGTPGIPPAGTFANSGIFFTEIMYDPASDETMFEWVEIYNNTGSTLNLAGYVFDDDDDIDLLSANITSGSIPQGEVGVLFNSSLSIADMETIWGSGINFIPVDNFTALGNSGDAVALWDSFATYDNAAPGSNDHDISNAVASVTYDDDGIIWVNNNGQSSIELSNLSVADPTAGSSWILNEFAPTAAELIKTISVHFGGDVGSPGVVGGSTVMTSADFDGDGDVDGSDFLAWQAGFGTMSGAGASDGDSDGDGDVDAADLANWQAAYGTGNGNGSLTNGAVPEPASVLLVCISFLSLGFLLK